MFEILSIALKRKKYLTIALISAGILFAISFYLMTISVAGRSIDIYAEMNGVEYTFMSLILSLLVSMLFGFYFSLLFFLKDIRKKSNGAKDRAASLIGTVFGIMSSGCPSCGAPVLALIGVPFALMSFPLRGLEIKLASAILMIISIYYLCKNIEKSVSCSIGSVYEK